MPKKPSVSMSALQDANDDAGDDDDACYFESSLFLNEDYETVAFDVGGVTQRVLCLTSASTDHDLTGQVVWPVSVLLAWFVAANRRRFAGARVLEVGAGCGLPGLVADAVGADRVALTDGSDVVVRLLERAVEALRPRSASVARLLWGDRPSFEAVAAGASFDYVVGADVVCWPKLVAPLLQTVAALLAASTCDEAAFFVGFVARANSTKDLFFREAAARGFSVDEHEPASFLPDPAPANVHSALELRLIELRLAPTARRRAADIDFQSDDPAYAASYGDNAC